jgi:hypothetical protein
MADRTWRMRGSVFVRTGMCLLFVFVLIASLQDTPPQTLPLTGILPIAVPRIANTGQQIDVEIGPVTADNGTPVGLVLVGAHGPRVYNTTFEAGMARFVIPSKDTHQPGYMALIVAADNARGEASIILFTPRVQTVAYPVKADVSIG